MDIERLFDYAAKIAGIAALLIITVPKLAELVMGRFLSGSLEKYKSELQKDVELYKNDLLMNLETHKANHQKEIAKIQKKISVNYERQKDVENHQICLLDEILQRARKAISEINGNNEIAYTLTSAILQYIDTIDKPLLTNCYEYIETIDSECERPGALVDPDYHEKLKSLLCDLSSALEAEIARIKGGMYDC